MSAKALKNRVQIAKKKTLVNVGFYSEFPNNFGEIANIVDGGAIAFKLFMASQIGGLTIDNDQELKRAFRKVGDLDVPVAVHAEDSGILTVAEENQKKANRHDASAFLEKTECSLLVRGTSRDFPVTTRFDNTNVLIIRHVDTAVAKLRSQGS